MPTLDTVFATFAAESKSGRIGRPVSVRAFLELTADHGRLILVLARALEEAFPWLEDPARAVHVTGSIEAGHLTVLARGKTGTTALLSAAVIRGGPPAADVLVLGSRGSLHHEGPANAPHLGVARDGEDGELSAVGRAFYAAMERSLAAGGAPAAIEDRAGAAERR